MKYYNINFSTALFFTFLMIMGFQALLKGQDSYTQIQIGSQVMRNYNLEKLITIARGGFGYTEKRQSIATTFNLDISLTRTFDQHHGITLGGGSYNTCRWVDATVIGDDGFFTEFKNVKPCYKNYSLYFMYKYTTWLASRWNGHISAGPKWAKNHNMADWFYVPIKQNYFSAIAKLGLQYKVTDHFSVEVNGAVVQSMTNIVEPKFRKEGGLIPFLVGADLRVGYSF